MDKEFKFLNINNVFNNSINIAYNLTFYSVYDYIRNSKNEFTLWPDGKIINIIFNRNSMIYLRGPDLLRYILTQDLNSYSVAIVGDISSASNNFLSERINFHHFDIGFVDLINIDYTLFEKIKNHKFDLILITLPSPKQECVAELIKNEKSTIFCIGGALNMISKDEKECPPIISKFGLEFIWRIFQNDTKRRIKRLLYSLYKFLINFNKVKIVKSQLN